METAYVNVLVYGTLKRGGRLSHFLNSEDCNLLGNGKTSDAIWHMHAFGVVPYVVEGKAHIKGEVYSVPGHVLERLDMVENEGYMYRRVMIPVTLDHTYEKLQAYMYVLHNMSVAAYRDVTNSKIAVTCTPDGNEMHEWIDIISYENGNWCHSNR